MKKLLVTTGLLCTVFFNYSAEQVTFDALCLLNDPLLLESNGADNGSAMSVNRNHVESDTLMVPIELGTVREDIASLVRITSSQAAPVVESENIIPTALTVPGSRKTKHQKVQDSGQKSIEQKIKMLWGKTIPNSSHLVTFFSDQSLQAHEIDSAPITNYIAVIPSVKDRDCSSSRSRSYRCNECNYENRRIAHMRTHVYLKHMYMKQKEKTS